MAGTNVTGCNALRSRQCHSGQGLVSNEQSNSFLLASSSSPGNVTLEAEFAAVKRREPVGLVLAGRQGHTVPVSTLSFVGDGSQLLTASANSNPNLPGEIRLWDSERGMLQSTWRMPQPGAPLVTMLPGSHEAFVSTEGSSTLWKVNFEESCWENWKVDLPAVAIVQLEASADGKYLAAAAASAGGVTSIMVWDLAADRPQAGRTVGTTPAPVSLFKMHPNSQELAW